jgi:hypothetical protein
MAMKHAGVQSSFRNHASDTDSTWTGGFADQFRHATGQVGDRFTPVCEIAVDTALALSNYAAALEEAQQDMAALNHQAGNLSVHLDPLDRIQAMSQFGQQAGDITDQLDHAASVCASRLAQVEHHLATALPDTRSAEQLHTNVRRAVAGVRADQPGVWEHTEPERKVLEGLLAPFDIGAGDHWVDLLKKAGEEPVKLVEAVDEGLQNIEELLKEGEFVGDELIQTAQKIERTGRMLDAWAAFAPRWGETAARFLSEVDGLSYAMDGLGLIADTGTLVGPQDTGVLGDVDRAAAGANALGILTGMAAEAGWLGVADGVTAPIPVVGEVVIAVTGIYLAGDFAYHHWTPFRDAVNDIVGGDLRAAEYVGQGIGDAAVDIGSGDVRAAEDAGRAAADVGKGVVDGSKEIGHKARSVWHTIASPIGSWF